MNTLEETRNRIDEVLESLLSESYRELNIDTGDIAPEQELEWKRLTTDMASLFNELFKQNS